MNQQQNLFTQEMFESPELMEAVIESYLDANPMIKTYSQGLIQLVSSFADNFSQQYSALMNTKNNVNNKNDNEKTCDKNSENNVNENHSQNEKSYSNDNDNDNKNDNVNNNQNDNTNEYENVNGNDQNQNSNHQVDDIFSFLNQVLGGNNLQQLFATFMPFIQKCQNPQQESELSNEKGQKQETKKDIEENQSLIQDLIIQTLNPSIFESNPIPSDNDNDDIEKKEENDENNQNKIFNLIEMLKVLYQIYLQNKENPDNFIHPLINSLNNIIIQFFPNLHSVFSPMFDNLKLNEFDFSNLFPFANSYLQMMNSSMNQANAQSNHKSDQCMKHAELKRTKFIDDNGKVKTITRYSIGEKWYEIENEMNSNGEECKIAKETWNNISEESFEDFMNEWKKLFEMQNK